MEDVYPQEVIKEYLDEWDGEPMPSPIEVDVIPFKKKYHVRISLPRRDGTVIRLYSPVAFKLEKAKELADTVIDFISTEAAAHGGEGKCEKGWIN
jgi:hypothetical protein